MSIIDDYKRHRARYQRYVKRGIVGGEYSTCPMCGREGVKLEFHHIGRQACDDRAIPVCRDCHDRLSECQQHEHHKLGPNPKNKCERLGRLLLGFVDIDETKCGVEREVAELLIALAKKYPDLDI